MPTWYEKRGRRYYPIAEHDLYRFDALTKGTYLMVIQPGGHSWTRLVEPASGEVEAAMRIAEQAMIEAMQKMNQSSGEPSGLLTDEEKQLARKAWKAYCDVMGRERTVSFRGVSMHDVVEAGIKALRKHIKKSTTSEPA